MLEHFIKLYPNAASVALCEQLMQLFEANPNKTQGKTASGISDAKYSIELYIDPNRPELAEVDNALYGIFSEYARRYFADVPWFNPCYRDVGYFIKKYPKERGYFNTHVDVSVAKNSRRMLAMILYLNTVPGGGETIFGQLDCHIHPKQGSLLLFPPMWMYPHRSAIPLATDKYTVNTFLEFEEQ